MILSRITSKSQTTVPRAVRAALGVGPGDTLTYHIEDGAVRIGKLWSGDPFDNPLATFTEWTSEFDVEDFRDL